MVSIDGQVKRWPVRLPDGVAPGRVRMRIEDGAQVTGPQ
jgi:hypothetical protein